MHSDNITSLSLRHAKSRVQMDSLDGNPLRHGSLDVVISPMFCRLLLFFKCSFYSCFRSGSKNVKWHLVT
uniref:Uncharacterized protein n=1 Tax=Rhizophora mucronata TaxID=61149 RepID=A0A2P2P9Q9_RHIMU